MLTIPGYMTISWLMGKDPFTKDLVPRDGQGVNLFGMPVGFFAPALAVTSITGLTTLGIGLAGVHNGVRLLGKGDPMAAVVARQHRISPHRFSDWLFRGLGANGLGNNPNIVDKIASYVPHTSWNQTASAMNKIGPGVRAAGERLTGDARAGFMTILEGIENGSLRVESHSYGLNSAAPQSLNLSRGWRGSITLRNAKIVELLDDGTLFLSPSLKDDAVTAAYLSQAGRERLLRVTEPISGNELFAGFVPGEGRAKAYKLADEALEATRRTALGEAARQLGLDTKASTSGLLGELRALAFPSAATDAAFAARNAQPAYVGVFANKKLMAGAAALVTLPLAVMLGVQHLSKGAEPADGAADTPASGAAHGDAAHGATPHDPAAQGADAHGATPADVVERDAMAHDTGADMVNEWSPEWDTKFADLGMPPKLRDILAKAKLPSVALDRVYQVSKERIAGLIERGWAQKFEARFGAEGVWYILLPHVVDPTNAPDPTYEKLMLAETPTDGDLRKLYNNLVAREAG